MLFLSKGRNNANEGLATYKNFYFCSQEQTVAVWQKDWESFMHEKIVGA